jgi:hypothetical protein
MAARLVWDQVHAGSIPVSPTERAWCKGNTLAFQASAASSILAVRSNAGLAQWQSAAFVKRRFAGRSRGSARKNAPLWCNGKHGCLVSSGSAFDSQLGLVGCSSMAEHPPCEAGGCWFESSRPLVAGVRLDRR